MIKQAVILAGGLGSRLGDMTQEMPKGFIQLEGVSMVERSVQKLLASGVEQIIIGTGHCKKWYEDLARKYHVIQTAYNKDYAITSSMGTLKVCSDFIKGDFLLLESDLVYDSIGLYALLNDKHTNVVLASGATDSGDEVYIQAQEGLITAINKDKTSLQATGELVGISKLSRKFLDKMLSWYEADLEHNIKADYESAIAKISLENASKNCEDESAYILKIDDYTWTEVDTEAMLKRCKTTVYPTILQHEKLRQIKREILLNPGPSTTSDSVKYAQVVPDICPRESEFGDIMLSIQEDLTHFVAKDDYTTVMFGGSGTAADEAMVSSCVHDNGKLLVINNGSYGERLAKIASVYRINMQVFTSSTYEPLDLNALEDVVKKGGFTTLASVYHETTTGLLNPIKDICGIAHKYGLTTCVDAVSAYAGIPMNLRELGIDFASATSNKHIGGMAGVAFVICNKDMLESQKNDAMRSYYLNLYDQYKYFLSQKQTRFTPPVQTMYALRQAIIETKVETIEARYKRFTACWQVLVEALEELKLEMLVKKQYQSHFITAVKIPPTPRYNFKDFHDKARQKGFTIYPGKLGNIDTFRIANMGDIRVEEMQAFIPIMKDYMHCIGV